MGATSLRTHRCGALRPEHVGEDVRLGGWVHRRRDLGGLTFLDVRDRDGIVQVAVGAEFTDAASMTQLDRVTMETVVLVTGIVQGRPADALNPDMATGGVEVRASTLAIVGVADPALPIPVWRTKGEDLPSEERRLEHRPLDLRRPELQRNFALRHRLLQRARAVMTMQGFLEIETPILTKPTPEGARDYLVPSRVHRGEFYALPQSPQIYKQLLMIAGFDRYFQIARCFRDEDLRADRQPEFTQIDIEASFVTPPDIYQVLETLCVALWAEAGHEVVAPFTRLAHGQALERYGTDKPDARWDIELRDVTAALATRGFQAFDTAVERGGRIRGISVPGGAALSRKAVDALTDLARAAGVGGLATLKRQGDAVTGPLAKLPGIEDALPIEDGDLWLVAAGEDTITSPALDAVRRGAIQAAGVEPSRPHAFLWVDDFPLFELDAETGHLVFAHHPFTAPHPDDLTRVMAGERLGIRAQHYDLVYNGNELGSGSIRITDAAVQRKVFESLGLSDTEAEHRFGFLLRALRTGAPPHGGFAVGFDRVAMLLAGASSLRDVIAFPKTTAARALFEAAPTKVEEDDLRDLGISVRS